MKKLDKILQNARINKAKKFIREGDVVLDIGSADGVMFEKLRGRISSGVGIDPALEKEIKTDFYRLIPGYFPEAAPKGKTFDAITMLAVLEHIPIEKQKLLAKVCWHYLNKKGRVIVTVPSLVVDYILEVSLFLKLMDGMSVDEHHGFKPKDTKKLFVGKRFKLIHYSAFQLGLNHIFVFEKIN